MLNQEASDLISKMLATDPEKRITAKQVLFVIKQILEHPWI